MNGFLFLLALIGLFLPETGQADEACQVTADHPLIGQKHWYGLYYEDQKIGHAVVQTSRDQPDAKGDDPATIS